MEREDSARNIYLTGFMGSGKTSVGKILADLLDRTFVDTDLLIERHWGMSIPEIFVKEGEKAFRTMESQIVEDLKAKNGMVVSLGGGTFMDPENRKSVMESGTVVYLKIPLEESLQRIEGSSRPLAEEAAIIFHDRISIYELAHVHIDASGMEPIEVAKRIMDEVQ